MNSKYAPSGGWEHLLPRAPRMVAVSQDEFDRVWNATEPSKRWAKNIDAVNLYDWDRKAWIYVAPGYI